MTEVNAQNYLSLPEAWREYEAARSSDRPLRQIEILSRIKKEALSSKLPADFYRAGELYVDLSSSRNWKLRDSLQTAFDSEIESCVMPVCRFYHMSRKGIGDLTAFIHANKDALSSAGNPYFWNEDYRLSSGNLYEVADFLRKRITNDYEYALWAISIGGKSPDAVSELRSMIGYPKTALLDFSLLSDSDEKDALIAFQKKYAPQAASMLSEERLLSMRFDSLQMKNASSEQYQAFRNECTGFEKRRAAYSSDEKKLAECLEYVSNIIGTMDSESLSAHVRDGHLLACVRNLKSVSVELRKSDDKGGLLWNTTLKNPRCSYYAPDTLECDLPDVDDGSYHITVSSGKKNSCELEYDRYSISISCRRDEGGMSMFAADYRTGEPVKKADVLCTVNGKKSLEPVRNLSFNGFTRLPSYISDALTDARRYEIYCTYTDADGHVRRSSPSSFYDTGILEEEYDSGRIMAAILPNCTAFNPGQSLSFKAILYTLTPEGGYRTLEQGEKALVSISDPDGNNLQSFNLLTDSFGSVSGSCTFPSGCKGGVYRLDVRYRNSYVGATALRVDEYVLPTYDLVFDPVDELHFPGDTVTVKGRLYSYSGHPVSSAHLTYGLRGVVSGSGQIAMQSDGRFAIDLTVPEQRLSYMSYAGITVKVVDDSGETREYSTSFNVTGQLYLSARLENADEGRTELLDRVTMAECMLISASEADLAFSLNSMKKLSGAGIRYRLTEDGREVLPWQSASGFKANVSFGGLASGIYRVEARAEAVADDGKVYSDDTDLYLLYLPVEEGRLELPVENVFRYVPGDDIAVQVGSSRETTWAVVELFGKNGRLLKSQLIKLGNELKTIRYEYVPGYDDQVTLYVMYFRNGARYSYSHEYSRMGRGTLDLPLSVERFTDMSSPAAECSMTFLTKPGVQCAATVFDKSTETIMSNVWQRIDAPYHRAPYVNYNCALGRNGESHIVRYAMKSGAVMSRAASANYMAVEEETVEMAAALDDSANGSVDISDVDIRENFAEALYFNPAIMSDNQGRIELSFKTSDKLSIYFVQLFAHDKGMHNATIRREMLVTIPVKVSVNAPRLLYTDDRYVMKATVSNMCDEAVSGKLFLEGYGAVDCQVPAGGTTTENFIIDVPQTSSMEFLLAFKSDKFSDAVRFRVPVHPAKQVITESHSIVVRPGDSPEGLSKELLARFVNGSGYGAEYSERSIRQMLMDELPEHFEADNEDVLSLSSALYSNLLSAKITGGSVPDLARLTENISKCVCPDGGFAWYEGMKSSPVITAVMLERIASMKKAGVLPDGLLQLAPAAAAYLDKVMFTDRTMPLWCGWISMEQYMSVRSEFAYVPLESAPSSSWKKAARAYLVPKNVRGLNGQIFAKARRMEILHNLLGSSEGVRLSRGWGLGTFSGRKMKKSLVEDTASLLEYAVPHKSGGIYYPNAVMPFRGLMESEIYAHTHICRLMDTLYADGFGDRCSEVSDGIRLWMMIQKETQKWNDDPSFVEAAACILEGPGQVLDTKVAVMTMRFELGFKDIKASGNGFALEYVWSRCNSDGTTSVLADGDILSPGDKVAVTYRIWNEENRSFVRLTIPHPACLSPEDQLSGYYGWRLKPLYVNGLHNFVPQGYREVKSDNRIIFNFDSYPEEKTEITQNYFVTQEGLFQSPVPEIESLYAPHYRANASFSGPVDVK